jgi:hypothetical protein
MCEHLAALDRHLKESGFEETFRGQAWSNNCREWAYYDCVLNFESLRKKFNLPDFVVVHFNDDPRSGLEAGFTCEECKDGVIGAHPSVGKGKIVVN